MSYSPIKSVPYYSTYTSSSDQALASSLRADFAPTIKRLLPFHYVGGLKHDSVIEFIKKYSPKYRYFLKTDIQKFFPNIRHQDLIVGIQLAHRQLHNLDYVPDKFKKKYLGRLLRWTNDLPFDHKGIPLSSPVSGIAAPLMLLPLWLDIKRRWKLLISVFVDDVVILCDNSTLCALCVRSLSSIYDKHCLKFARGSNSHPCTQFKQTGQGIKRTDSSQQVDQLIASIEALSAKMTEAIALEKKQLHHLKILTASL